MLATGSDARALEATCCLLGSLGGDGVSMGVGLTWAEAGASTDCLPGG